MRRPALVLVLLAALGSSSCGAEDPPRRPPASPQAGDAPAPPVPTAAEAAAPRFPLPTGVSAFRLASEPDAVQHSIPLDFLRNGLGRPNPRDGIPALYEPEFVPTKEATFLHGSMRMIVAEAKGELRAYAIPLLDRHELVNDVIQGVPILVSWCPLCGSAVVYDRVVHGHTLTFGVSGFLYKSDVLMYDRETESFWSQLGLGAVAGPFTGALLTVRPSYVTTLEALTAEHPEALVLKRAKGMLADREYASAPYANYLKNDRLWFPVGEVRKELPPKVEVLGVRVGLEAWAFALADLRALAGEGSEAGLEHEVGGTPLKIVWTKAGDVVRVWNVAGEEVPAIRLFWFAWAAFEPETRLWKPE